MIVAVASMWIFRICTGVWLAKYVGLGLLGVWLAMFVDWIGRIVVFVIRYRGDRWLQKYVR